MVLGLFLASVVQAGDPFAPMIPMAEKPPKELGVSEKDWEQMLDLMAQQSAQDSSVPSKHEVGVPAPPNSFYFSSGDMGEIKFVSLVSQDEVDKLRKFYKDSLDQLPGWKWSDEFSIFHKSEGSLTMQKIMSMSIPIIEVDEVNDDTLAWMFLADEKFKASLKSLVKITYYPN
jgi:hypothetical protein